MPSLRHHLSLYAMTLFAAAASACAPAASPVGSSEEVPLGFEARTTESDVAFSNLDASIAALTSRAERRPSDIKAHAQLIEALLTRSSFAGTYGDFRSADRLSQSLLERFPSSARATASRAHFLAAVHRFDEALELYLRARTQGLAESEVERALISVAVAQGNLEGLEARARALAEGAGDGYAAHVALASVLAASGDFAQADAAYRQALASYDDASPFPIARIQFQRGVMWAEMAANDEVAHQLYVEAVRRVEGYSVATIHLAELEATSGDVEGARSRLRTVVGVGNPEAEGLLGELSEDGEVDIALADAGYRALLAEHREAFLDHAAEFFSGPGNDPGFGLELALENLELRQNARAYVVAIEAAMAAEDESALGELIDVSEEAAVNHPVLAELREEAAQGR